MPDQVETAVTWEELVRDVTKWQRATFPESTPLGIANHLHEEADELAESVEHDNLKYITAESADVLLLLIGLADKLGIDLIAVTREKLAVNKQRTWGNRTPAGYWKHDSDAVIGRGEPLEKFEQLPDRADVKETE